MALATGIQLGSYEILCPLGAGVMGEVYLAADITELARTVALKFLPEELASDPQRMQRCIQEARTISALNHPNILIIYKIGEEETAHFITAELIARWP